MNIDIRPTEKSFLDAPGIPVPPGWTICPNCLGTGGEFSDERKPDYHIMPGYIWKECQRCSGRGGWR